MHRSVLTIAASILVALAGTLDSRCAAQTPNAPVQAPLAAEAAHDPFTLEAAPADAPLGPTGSSPAHAVAPQRIDPVAHAAPLPRLLKPNEASDGPALPQSSDASTLLTVGGSLTLVLGLFLLVTWAVRRGTPAGSTLLPREVVEMLGRAPLPGRQQMHLVRVGSKLLLLHITPNGAETLTEITDPLEVDRLIGLCHQRGPHSSTAAFHSVLADLSRSGGQDNFELDDDRPARARRGSSATRTLRGADG